jgi:DNA gyrase subunit B
MQNSYGDLTKLNFPDNIRARSGMYIGDVQDGSGLHHMIWEVLDNSVDEFLAGHCKNIWITLNSPTEITLRDDGRGIPTSFNEKEKKTNLELALEDLHAGGKFSADNYRKSGGLHGVGIKAVNALSAHIMVRVYNGDKATGVSYSKGKKVYGPSVENNTNKYPRGTSFSFSPDNTIFTNVVTFSKDIIIERIKQTAYLNSGLAIHFDGVTYHYENGLLNFINEIDKSTQIALPIVITDDDGKVELKMALKWNTTSKEIYQCFTNNTYQKDGGTHLTSLRYSLTKVLLPYFKEEKIEVISDDLREGLSYIISIYIEDPKFSSQTKDKLVNSEIKGALDKLIQENLQEYFDKNQLQLTRIKEKILLNAKAREAAKRAKENVTKNSSLVFNTKLAACSEQNEANCELFLVEGDSAGGSAKQARNRKFQAILPLRGKILNVEKSSAEKVAASKEINVLKQVIGSFPNYNYHKIIILTDADVDGSHIRTLLLTLFYRQMPDLIEQGYVYIGKPPLYKVTLKKKDYYLLNDAALQHFIAEKGNLPKGAIQRYKGLGEMNPDQLWTTTMNPTTRTLERVTMENILEAENSFNMLMGSEVGPRKDFIINSPAWKNLRID